MGFPGMGGAVPAAGGEPGGDAVPGGVPQHIAPAAGPVHPPHGQAPTNGRQWLTMLTMADNGVQGALQRWGLHTVRGIMEEFARCTARYAGRVELEAAKEELFVHMMKFTGVNVDEGKTN
jgi:hypothetical protein